MTLPFLFFGRILLREPAVERSHLGLCLRQRDARLQSPVRMHEVEIALSSRSRVVDPEGDENVGMLHRWSKTRRHHADHCVRLSTKVNRLAHCMWIAAKVVLPEMVTDH